MKNFRSYKDKAIELDDSDREVLARSLFSLVADNFSMTLKGFNFHWNVVSPIFEDLHEMFGEDYTSLLGHADLIAERIRALGFSVPGSLNIFQDNSIIQDQNSVLDWSSMVSEWIQDHVSMSRRARETQKVAQSVGDSNTLAMLDSIILHHDKRAWMFRSIINRQPDRFPAVIR